jgi:outer membrane murein-binding lipoprotein Lpp
MLHMSAIKRPFSLILVALLAVGLASCGSTVSTSKFKGESKAVAARISNFQSDVTAMSEQKLCAKDLASAVQARLHSAHSSCQQALKSQLGAIDDYELAVEKIAVHGATATALVKSTWSGKQRLSTLTLVKEGGAWRITGLS